MKLWLERYGYGADSTLGKIYDMTTGAPKFLCYCLEDERREVKVMHETAIPVGVYEILYHKSSRFKARYAAKYEWHRDGWMLHLQNVPGFEGILIHPGNTDDDTSGCLLPGTSPSQIAGHYHSEETFNLSAGDNSFTVSFVPNVSGPIAWIDGQFEGTVVFSFAPEPVPTLSVFAGLALVAVVTMAGFIASHRTQRRLT